jgi:hypothetical protein
MRKFLLGVLLLPALVVAQPVTVEKPVICEKTELVIGSLLNGEYKEQPVWIGVDESSKYSLFVNDKTKTWTMIQFNQQMACIIAVGIKAKMVFSGPDV